MQPILNTDYFGSILQRKPKSKLQSKMLLVHFPLLIYLGRETAFNLTVFFRLHSIRGNWTKIDLGSEIYHYPQKMDNKM